jgi:hypothetical protein
MIRFNEDITGVVENSRSCAGTVSNELKTYMSEYTHRAQFLRRYVMTTRKTVTPTDSAVISTISQIPFGGIGIGFRAMTAITSDAIVKPTRIHRDARIVLGIGTCIDPLRVA